MEADTKPWWRKKKVWGTLLAVAIGLAAPALGASWVSTLTAAVSLMTGVACEAIVDAAAALGQVTWKD